MTNNYMLKKLEKLKGLLGYSDNSEEVAQASSPSPSYEDAIKKETESQTVVCDCCNNSEIIITVTDMFKIGEAGERIALFTHPQVDCANGGIFDDVAICDECFATCQNDTHKQFVWLTGKINSVYKDIEAKNKFKTDNMALIEEIRTSAEAKMMEVMNQNNEIDLEISNLQNTIEHFAQEQSFIEQNL